MTLSASSVYANDADSTKKGLVNFETEFVKKGTWGIGFTGGYSTHENTNYTVVLAEETNSLGYSVYASPFVSYSLTKNSSLILKFNYRRSLIKIDKSKISFGDEEGGIHLSVKDYYGINQTFYGSVAWRQFIPIGNSKRVALFVDGELEIGRGQSKFAFDSPVKGTYAINSDMGLNINPGMMVFVSDHFAVEASVGLAGVSYSKVNQIHNQVDFGKIDEASIRYKLDLLSLDFSIAYYF